MLVKWIWRLTFDSKCIEQILLAVDALRELLQGHPLVPAGCLGFLSYHIRGEVNRSAMPSHRHLLVAYDVRLVLHIVPALFALVSEQFTLGYFDHLILRL